MKNKNNQWLYKKNVQCVIWRVEEMVKFPKLSFDLDVNFQHYSTGYGGFQVTCMF